MTPKSAPFYPLPLMTHLAHYKVNGMTIFLSLLTPAPPPRARHMVYECSPIFVLVFFTFVFFFNVRDLWRYTVVFMIQLWGMNTVCYYEL